MENELNEKNQFDRNIFQRAAEYLLKDLIPILNEMGIKYWLDAGTCLGAIRDGDFIPHDLDMDIGLFDVERADELEKKLFENGFINVNRFGSKDNGYEFAYSKHGVKVDFFFFYKDGDKTWHSAWQYEKQLFFDFPSYLLEDLKEIEFRGLKVYVPNPPEEYLTIKYGDWKKVVTDWDWANSPKNKRV